MNESLMNPKSPYVKISHCKNHQCYSYQNYSLNMQTEEIINLCQIISRSFNKNSDKKIFGLARKFFGHLLL